MPIALDGAVGHAAIGDNLFVWCSGQTLCGLVLWGRPSAGTIGRLARLFDAGQENSGIATPCDIVLDVRRLEHLHAGFYDELVRFVATRSEAIRRRVRRHALVRGLGLTGAALSGFYDLWNPGFEWQGFSALSPALDWLGHTAAVAHALELLVAEAVDRSSIVDRLRDWLRSNIHRRTPVNDAARALGVSRRTLQRRLREAATSFRGETDAVRVAIAQELLLASDDKIAAIAEHVGSSSEANFIASFRRVVGIPPASWRRQNRP